MQALSWAFNRGALCTGPHTLTQFLAVCAAPVTPIAAGSAGAPSAGTPTAPQPAGPAADTRSRTHTAGSTLAAAKGGALANGTSRTRGSKGRLGEDAGSWGGMLAAWSAKSLLIATLLWLLQHPLPGFIYSFACGACFGGCGACFEAAREPAMPAVQP